MRSDHSSEDERAAHELIGGYVRALDSRRPLLERLFSDGYPREATLLCCCYIESLGNIYSPNRASAYAFVNVLLDNSNEPMLSYVHPQTLRNALRSAGSSRVREIALKIDLPLASAEGHLYTMDEIAERTMDVLTEDEQKTLRGSLWRGTVAAIAYKEFRCDLVHALSAPDAVTFSGVTVGGDSVPPLDFPLLYRALRAVLHTLSQAFPFPAAS